MHGTLRTNSTNSTHPKWVQKFNHAGSPHVSNTTPRSPHDVKCAYTANRVQPYQALALGCWMRCAAMLTPRGGNLNTVRSLSTYSTGNCACPSMNPIRPSAETILSQTVASSMCVQIVTLSPKSKMLTDHGMDWTNYRGQRVCWSECLSNSLRAVRLSGALMNCIMQDSKILFCRHGCLTHCIPKCFNEMMGTINGWCSIFNAC